MRLRPICAFAILTIFSLSIPAIAKPKISPSSALTDSQWETVREQLGLLDKIAFIPSLLPVIMKHRDSLELTDTQIAVFQEWRKLHYRDMVDLMNEITQHRITLSKATLDVHVSGDDILAQQQAIFRLQERLLRIRLSCRNLIVETFSAEQWGNLAFVLEEYPMYAGLLGD